MNRCRFLKKNCRNMEPSAETEKDIEISKYLEAGKQTQITPKMENIAKRISGSTLEKTQKILGMMSQLRTEPSNSQIFRKRTADQIIKDRFVTGCTDNVVAFVAAERACGVPAKYVETVDKIWLENGGENITGHQYAQIYDAENNQWIWVDPTFGRVNTPAPGDEGRVIVAEGLDSWNLGMKDLGSMRKTLNAFRKDWIEKNEN
jgi:hypothetical protein